MPAIRQVHTRRELEPSVRGVIIAICVLSALAGACAAALCALYLLSLNRRRRQKKRTTKMILDDAMKMGICTVTEITIRVDDKPPPPYSPHDPL